MLKTPTKLIVFFIPPEEIVSGGVMSIFSLCRETRNLFADSTAVIISTFPGTSSYEKNTLFKNSEYIYDFETAINKYSSISSLTLHIPEYAVERIAHNLAPYRTTLDSVGKFTINILNQNMELMPPPETTASLYALSPDIITQTTAHKRYTTQDLANRYNTPVMNLSVFLDTNQYAYTQYDKKENIIAYSNDKCPEKDAILLHLKNKLPHYTFVEITGLSYEAYKDLIARSKYIITFGEGFDGYLIEGIFSGGITFAVYNDTFFASKEFLQYENIYKSYSEMKARIVNDITILDNEQLYLRVNRRNFTTLSKIYNYKKYLRNLKKFYNQEFTFKPSKGAIQLFFNNAIYSREQIITRYDRSIYEKDLQIQTHAHDLSKANALLLELSSQLAILQQINKSQANTIEKIEKTMLYKIFKKIKSFKKNILKV